MFNLPNRGKLIPTDDIIPFIDLLSRWPYEPVVKIAYEYYNDNLQLHFVASCFHSNGQDYAVLQTATPIEQSQSFACWHFDRIVYFREDIEKIEQLNPFYASTPVARPLFERPFDIYSEQIASHLAAEALNVLQILHWQYKPIFSGWGKAFPDKSLISNWMTKDRIYNPEHCLPAPKKNWRICPSLMTPVFRKPSPLFIPQKKQSIDYDALDNLVAQKRSQGITDPIELGLAILSVAPEISNGALARLVYNIEAKNPRQHTAARQRGMTLRKKIIKSHA